MSDRCSFLHSKHVLEAKVTASNLPLIRCLRCGRVWDYDGYERIPFGYESWKDWKSKSVKAKSLPSQSPEWHHSKYITLDYEQLNPLLVEYVIKFMNIEDKATIDALRKFGEEKRFSITHQLFKS